MLKITPLTVDATTLNYHTVFTDRTGNKTLSSTSINTQENLKGTRKPYNTRYQIQSHFVNE